MLLLYFAVLENSEQEDRFEQIYTKYKRKVANISFAILKDEDLSLDATHDTFFKIAKNIKHLPLDQTHERAYIYEVARYSSIDLARKHKIKILTFNEEKYFSEKTNSPDTLLIRKEMMNIVMSAIDKLGENYRRALIMRYVDDMKYSDIATIMNMPESTVKSYVKRGIGILRLSLAEINN